MCVSWKDHEYSIIVWESYIQYNLDFFYFSAGFFDSSVLEMSVLWFFHSTQSFPLSHQKKG